jgi:hypothetical protein
VHPDLRGGRVDLAQVFRGKIEVGRADILLQARQLRGPRDRDDPGLLRQQPGERDPGGRRGKRFADELLVGERAAGLRCSKDERMLPPEDRKLMDRP